MKITEIYFSPTGGTKKVSEVLSTLLSNEVESINLTDRNINLKEIKINSDDVAVISIPSYGGRVPHNVTQKLRDIKGNGARAVLVCVYGNRAYEDTLIELMDTVKESGFKVISAVSAIAEHSIARQFASGRPDEMDLKKIAEFADEIKNKIEKNDYKEPEIPGNRPYKKYSNGNMIPKPNKSCNKCGICIKECPVGAIDNDNPKKVDGDKCISCMRCISVCPNSARKLNPVALSAVSIALKTVCSDRKECELFI